LEYAKSEACQKEVGYWQSIENLVKETCLIPDCEKKSEGSEYLTISLNEKETSDLIYEVPKKYDSHINDILLTALTLAVGDVSNNYEFSFTLEGHGREDVIGLDISRTIGWFTSIFPVFLKITDPKDLIGGIKEVKTVLRKIPNKGIGYGIIRYYTDKLSRPLPKISFNYLGQWDAGISDEGIFQYAKESSGNNRDPKNKSYNLIDMNGGVKNSIFEMGFEYRVDFYKSETIEKFANQFKRRLLDMISN
jgi:surfactin family lipopeptide synthetase A/lichenysin synthetase A